MNEASASHPQGFNTNSRVAAAKSTRPRTPGPFLFEAPSSRHSQPAEMSLWYREVETPSSRLSQPIASARTEPQEYVVPELTLWSREVETDSYASSHGSPFSIVGDLPSPASSFSSTPTTPAAEPAPLPSGSNPHPIPSGSESKKRPREDDSETVCKQVNEEPAAKRLRPSKTELSDDGSESQQTPEPETKKTGKKRARDWLSTLGLFGIKELGGKDKPFSCPYCMFWAKSCESKDIARHIRTHRNPQNRRHPLRDPKRWSFDSLAEYIKGLITGNTRLEEMDKTHCSLCNKDLSRKDALKRHLREVHKVFT
jgi:hypothetical protein